MKLLKDRWYRVSHSSFNYRKYYLKPLLDSNTNNATRQVLCDVITTDKQYLYCRFCYFYNDDSIELIPEGELEMELL